MSGYGAFSAFATWSTILSQNLARPTRCDTKNVISLQRVSVLSQYDNKLRHSYPLSSTQSTETLILIVESPLLSMRAVKKQLQAPKTSTETTD